MHMELRISDKTHDTLIHGNLKKIMNLNRSLCNTQPVLSYYIKPVVSLFTNLLFSTCAASKILTDLLECKHLFSVSLAPYVLVFMTRMKTTRTQLSTAGNISVVLSDNESATHRLYGVVELSVMVVMIQSISVP